MTMPTTTRLRGQSQGQLLQQDDLRDEQPRRINYYDLRQLIEHAEEENIITDVLPGLTGDVLYDVIPLLTTQCCWRALGKLLQRDDLSNNQRRQITGSCIAHGGVKNFLVYALPHCVEHDLDCFVERLIERLGEFLQQNDLDEEQRRQIANDVEQRRQIIEHAEEENIKTCISPRRTPDDLHHVIPLLITRCWWRTSGELLQGKDLSDERRRQIIGDVIDHCSDKTFGNDILPNCAVDDLSYVIERLMTRPFWKSFGKLLHRNDLSDEQRGQIIKEFIVRGGETKFLLYAFPHCVGRDLDCFVEQLIERLFWKTLGKLLQWDDLGEEQRRRITDAVELRRQLIKYAKQKDIWYILRYCTVDELDQEIAVLIKRRWWHPLGMLLQRNDLSDEQRRSIIDGAIKRGAETSFYSSVLPHCAGSELDHVMSQLITRSWWRALVRLLQRGDLSEVQHRQIGGEAIQPGDGATSRCAGSELTLLIQNIIEHSEWWSLGKLLQRSDLSEEQRKRITFNAERQRQLIQHANEEDIMCILRYCHANEPGIIIQLLISLCRWRALCKLLQGYKLSVEQCKCIITRVIQHVDETTFRCDVLPHCAHCELDPIIRQLITRRWWQALDTLLQSNDLNVAQRRQIILSLIHI